MVFAVIFFVESRVAQAEIGGQIDDFTGQAGVDVDLALAFAVRQGQ